MRHNAEALTAIQQSVLAFVRARPGWDRVRLVRALAADRGVALTTAQAAYDRLVAKGVLGPQSAPLLPLLCDVGRFLGVIQVAGEHRAECLRLRERILEAGGGSCER